MKTGAVYSAICIVILLAWLALCMALVAFLAEMIAHHPWSIAPMLALLLYVICTRPKKEEGSK